MKIYSNIAKVIATFIVLASFTGYATGVAADGGATLKIQPDTLKVNAGDTFDVQVVVDVGSNKTIAAQCGLKWSPAADIECTGVDDGAFFKSAGGQRIGDPTIDNDNGEVMSFGIFATAGGGVSGSGTLFTYHFNAKSNGVVIITIPDKQMYVGGGTTSPVYPVVSDTNSNEIKPLTLVKGIVQIGDAPILADLAVSNAKIDWVTQGKTYRVSYTITNAGAVDAPATTTAIFVNDALKENVTCPALAVGASDTRAVGPYTLSSQGTDTIKIVADAGNQTQEISKDNNVFESTFPSIQAPDFTVTDLKLNWVTTGETYNATFTINNGGKIDSPASKAGIYIDDNFKESVDIGPLAVNATETHTAGPYTVSGDNDTVEVRANYDNAVNEANKDNNSKKEQIKAPPKQTQSTSSAADLPDLIVTNLSEYWEEEGKTYYVNLAVANEGKADAPASKAAVYVDGALAATVDIVPLAAGAQDTVTAGPFTFTAPGDTVMVTADSEDNVGESDEFNNSRGNKFSVASPAAGHISAPEFRPPTPGLTIAWEYIMGIGAGFILLVILVIVLFRI